MEDMSESPRILSVLFLKSRVLKYVQIKRPGSVKQWKEKSDRTQSPLTPFYYTDNSMCATK